MRNFYITKRKCSTVGPLYNIFTKICNLLRFIEISLHQNYAFGTQKHYRSRQFLVQYLTYGCKRSPKTMFIGGGSVRPSFVLESSIGVILHLHRAWRESCCFWEQPRHIDCDGHFSKGKGLCKCLLDKSHNMACDDGIIGSPFCCDNASPSYD